jgi:hypothetical protein
MYKSNNVFNYSISTLLPILRQDTMSFRVPENQEFRRLTKTNYRKGSGFLGIGLETNTAIKGRNKRLDIELISSIRLIVLNELLFDRLAPLLN